MGIATIARYASTKRGYVRGLAYLNLKLYTRTHAYMCVYMRQNHALKDREREREREREKERERERE